MIKVTDKEYWMDGYLVNTLQTAIYNMKRDWDFVFLISGDGRVRVGKSVLAQQIGYYVAHSLGKTFSMENIIFGSEKLMSAAKRLGYNNVFIYDEAREGLESKKTMRRSTQDLFDFFAECGMMNNFYIIVLPDFFDLPKGIAITRSDALINVKKTETPLTLHNGFKVNKYERGIFEYYDRNRKKFLYIHGKKNFNDYSIGKRNFYGSFKDFWVVNKQEYEQKKIAFIQRTKDETNPDQLSDRDKIILRMSQEYNLPQRTIADYTGLTQQRVQQILAILTINK